MRYASDIIVGDCNQVTLSPDPKGHTMPKRKAATKEWGPEALVEWMLKSKDVSKGNIKLLLESKEQIRQAWDWDDHGTKNFPVNTANLLYQIETTLKGQKRRRRSTRRKGIRPKAPTRLQDILPERMVQQVHEYLHEEPFREALAEMYSADPPSHALNRIKDTIDKTLFAEVYGYETLPK